MFPTKILELFKKESKGEAKSFAEGILEVFLSDLVAAVLNVGSGGFTHELECFEWRSENIIITDKNKEEISDLSKHPTKFLKKAIQMFEPQNRKFFTAHFFINNDAWHIFFWRGPDILGKEGGKVWGGEPHIHYSSYLFGQSLDVVKERITESGIEGIDNAHVKFDINK